MKRTQEMAAVCGFVARRELLQSSRCRCEPADLRPLTPDPSDMEGPVKVNNADFFELGRIDSLSHGTHCP
jgi:hypothetical protein